MSAGAMIQYLEEQKKADDLLLQKIKNNDKQHIGKNGTKGGKGGSRGNGKGQGTIKQMESKDDMPPTRVHPPYTNKVTWICPRCLWGN